MANPIIVGSAAPLQQKWNVKWSPTSGGESSIKFLGADMAQMLTLAQTNANAGISIDLNYGANVAELTLSATDPALQGFGVGFSGITDKWEVGVDLEKPELFENPNWLSMFTTLDASYLAAYGIYVSQQFFQFVKKQAEGSNPTWGSFITAMQTQNLSDQFGADIPATGIYHGSMYQAMLALDTPSWGGYSKSATLRFFVEEYFRGRTNFARSKYVLKHTTIAPCNYNRSVAEFNIEKIYSISQLLSEVQDSTHWILPLPAYLAYKILNYPVPVTMTPLYQWGALKMRSNAVLAARGRIEISQEYLIDSIAVPTYGLK